MFCRADVVRALPCLLSTFSNSYIRHPEVLKNSSTVRERTTHYKGMLKRASFSFWYLRYTIILGSEKSEHFLTLKPLNSELTACQCTQLRNLLHSQSLCQQLTKRQGWRERWEKQAGWIFASSARLFPKIENLTCKE